MRFRTTTLLIGAIAASSAVMADDTDRPVGRAILGSIRAVSAVSAVPLSIVGASLIVPGAVSLSAAGALSRVADAPIGKPLPITDATITVTPPNQALAVKESPKKALEPKEGSH